MLGGKLQPFFSDLPLYVPGPACRQRAQPSQVEFQPVLCSGDKETWISHLYVDDDWAHVIVQNSFNHPANPLFGHAINHGPARATLNKST